MKERALLVGVNLDKDEETSKSMQELKQLSEAAGADVISTVIQNMKSINSKTYIGIGKAREIYAAAEELDIDIIIFNDELTGSQQKNLQEELDRKVIDRTNLILDIFAQRATTNEGKLQVKLAQLKYRLPRLVGGSSYLSRTGGGIGTRGPGEQKLETDRRHILREIKNIETRLEKIKRNRETGRKKRNSGEIPIAALVGYTNAGKSTIMNELIKTADSDESREVFAKDMLFATLGTTLRRAKLKQGGEYLLIDTVGFVSKLPTNLVDAFKSTLEEIKYADLIIHVVDISNENIELQINTTNEILKDLDVLDKPLLYVFNKVDKVPINSAEYNFTNYKPCIFISAKNNSDIEKLNDFIGENIYGKKHFVKFCFSYDEMDKLSYFVNKYGPKNVIYEEESASIELKIDENDFRKYNKNVVEEYV